MKKTALKVIYDAAMTVIMLLLLLYSFTGGFLHEALGLAICGLFVLHKLFNLKWIAAVTKKFLDPKLDGLTKTRYIADVILLVLMIATGFSGVLVSNDILTDISAKNRALWVYLHNVSAYILFIVIAVHIGLHWEFIMAVFRKKLNLKDSKL